MRRVLVPSDIALRRSAQPLRLVRVGGQTMGTTWQVDAFVPAWVAVAALRSSIEVELDAITREMSTWRADSDLVRFNHAPAGSWVRVPARMWEVLVEACAIARASGGAFDFTVAPLVDLWGFGPVIGAAHRGTRPDAAALARARARTGWAAVELDRARRCVWQAGGRALDLSGIAKGYAVDRLSAIVSAYGALDHLVEIGGELRGHGHKPDGTPWWVGIERPPRLDAAGERDRASAALEPAHGVAAPAAVPETLVALHGLAVATSGDYRRRAVIDGDDCAHTIDPRTGDPVRNRVASVTVIHASCMRADAWATALLVAGPGEGARLAASHAVAALFVMRDGARLRELASPAFAALAAA